MPCNIQPRLNLCINFQKKNQQLVDGNVFRMIQEKKSCEKCNLRRHVSPHTYFSLGDFISQGGRQKELMWQNIIII